MAEGSGLYCGRTAMGTSAQGRSRAGWAELKAAVGGLVCSGHVLHGYPPSPATTFHACSKASQESPGRGTTSQHSRSDCDSTILASRRRQDGRDGRERHCVFSVDKLLNHVQGTISGVAAVYQHGQFLAERKAALEAWGRRITPSPLIATSLVSA